MLVSIDFLRERFGDRLQPIAGYFRVRHGDRVVTLGRVAAENSVELTQEGAVLLSSAQSAPDVNDELSALE